jgi:hypothetical protein
LFDAWERRPAAKGMPVTAFGGKRARRTRAGPHRAVG